MRLTHRSIRPAGREVSFTFNGSPVPALEGETVAAALSAAGILAYRDTSSGAPRGLHCGMGACWDCVVTVDGRIGQRACLVKVADGMRVSGGLPDQPQPLAPSPDTGPTPVTGPAPDLSCDVLVVGGGPAGLSAACAAAECGAETLLLDERPNLGGQFAKPLADSHADPNPDHQFRLGHELRRRAERAGVRMETEAICWGAFGPHEIGALIRGRAVTIRPKRLVLAPGAHERPVPLPGWTLPGVVTTGALQTLVRAQRVAPSDRVLIAGTGPLNLQLACELLDGGVKPLAVLEAAPRPGYRAWQQAWQMTRAAPDLVKDGVKMLARLKRAGVPVMWSTQLAALEGDTVVRRARFADRILDVGVVAVNLGFQPEVGLARALALPHRFEPAGVGYLATEVDEEGRTADPVVFAIGDGAALGGARVAQARGRLAGLAAARDLGFAAPDDTQARGALAQALAFQAALWRLYPPVPPATLTDDTIVCRCEEVTAGRLRAEIEGGATSIPALKKATRAGMGRCQGRFCAATVARLCPDTPAPDDFAAPRAPIRPVPAAPLMFEAPEFQAPLLTAPAPKVSLHKVPPLPAEARHAAIAVLGGGLAGLCSALYLAQGGADVLVIERDELGMAASTANAGSLHVQLLSYDFNAQTPEDGGPAAHTLPLAPRSIALWKEIGAAMGEDLGIRTAGGLMLAEDEAALAWLRRKSAMERRWGIESHVLGANELRTLAPAISDRMVGADFVPAEGYGDPLRGTVAVRTLAQRSGARFLRGAEVQAIERNGAGWLVRTSRGPVTAGTVVNATGPWAGQIGTMVGLDLPVTGTVQQVIVTEPAPRLTEHLIALANRHLSLKQQASGGFLVGGGWFGSFDPATGRTATLRENIQGNLWVCARALPALHGLSFVRAWTGINPAIDRAPILGEAPGTPGFFNAVSANGYTLGPVIGRMTADAILHGEAINPQYRVDRFG